MDATVSALGDDLRRWLDELSEEGKETMAALLGTSVVGLLGYALVVLFDLGAVLALLLTNALHVLGSSWLTLQFHDLLS